jgi:hypothetical protein
MEFFNGLFKEQLSDCNGQDGTESIMNVLTTSSRYLKGKAIPVTGLGGPIGLRDVEALTLPRQSTHR